MLSSFKKTSAISAAGYGKMFIKDVNGWTHSRPAIAQEVAWNTHCLQTSLTISLGENGRYIQHFQGDIFLEFCSPRQELEGKCCRTTETGTYFSLLEQVRELPKDRICLRHSVLVSTSLTARLVSSACRYDVVLMR